MTPSHAVPIPFQQAVDALRRAQDGDPGRPELVIEDMPAPQRLAPYSAAVSATVTRGDTEVAVGRLIVLYDPAGHSGWDGDFRVVAYISADLEPEIAADPLVGSVAWSWLIEALEPIGYAGVSGTVTRAVSESFGDKQDEPATTELELRASWSPLGDDPGQGVDIGGHVAAWCEVLCQAAGLPPSGVTAIPPRPSSSGS
ncbi:MAG TPA: DUF3000 domain-containing protein [Streptosporangiaceae bacterium]|jgi:hypothetical protein